MRSKQKLRFPLDQNQANVFRSLLRDETDRGCVLTTASLVELFLEGMLRAEFTRRSGSQMARQVAERLLTDPPAPPLGTLYLKTQLVFVLGLVDALTFSTLDAFRSIRNDAAHPVGPFSLAKYGDDAILALFSKDKIQHRKVRHAHLMRVEFTRRKSYARRLFEFWALGATYKLALLASRPEDTNGILAIEPWDHSSNAIFSDVLDRSTP